MDPSHLPNTVYHPGLWAPPSLSSPLDRRPTFNTIIHHALHVSPPTLRSPQHYYKSTMLSPSSCDDLPTPRSQAPTRPMQQRRIPSQISELSTIPSDWRSSRARDFDELYDVTDDESQEVPLKCSASVKKLAEDARSDRRNRYPSLIIPSPSAWPTIQKLQQQQNKNAVTEMSPTGPIQLSPAPNVLSMLAARTLQFPTTSATPSLDGSMTSEEMEHLSCPSTPDMDNQSQAENAWTPPVQLQPEALETLQHLSLMGSENDATQVVDLADMAEMEEVHQGRTSPPNLTPGGYESDNPLSPLSIPSPGGFFSSLRGSARQTWSVQSESMPPSTSVAERFYGVPWRASSNEPVPRMVEINVDPPTTDEPPTAKLTLLSGSGEEEEIIEIQPSEVRYEYNPDYEQELKKMSTANLDRTGSWLSAQLTYLSALCETSPTIDPESPSSPSHSRKKSLEGTATPSPSKKSVRFMEEAQKSPASIISEEQERETVFVEAFEYLWENAHKTDPYIHRQTRADAMHILRRHLATVHRRQLLGKYEITLVARPSPPRPVSSFYTDDPTVLKERIARAQKERQALEQVMPAVWVLHALKYLNGGKILCRQASNALCRATTARVLDVGGQATCDWAWQVAYDYQHATIYTVMTNPAEQTLNAEGPTNHKVTVIPNYWTFPFPSCHFDVISVRSLYALLKTSKPVGSRIDEFDLCLKECLRCLKPGGYLEFSVLDADIIHAGSLAQAMSAEFSFNLKTRGYDPTPTKSFLGRLRKAGFKDVKRSWMLMPMGKTAAKWNDNLSVGAGSDASEKTITPEGDVKPAIIGSTGDIAALTGLVGSWSWERWLVKLQNEMGKDEDRLLEGVPAVLEEGVKTGAGWRQLSGWARKAY